MQIDEAEIKKVRAKVIEIREAVFKQNESEVSKRWTFEEAVSITLEHAFSRLYQLYNKFLIKYLIILS